MTHASFFFPDLLKRALPLMTAPAPSNTASLSPLARFSKMAISSIGFGPKTDSLTLYSRLRDAALSGDLEAFKAALSLIRPVRLDPNDINLVFLPAYSVCQAPKNGPEMLRELCNSGYPNTLVGGPHFCPLTLAIKRQRWDIARHLMGQLTRLCDHDDKAKAAELKTNKIKPLFKALSVFSTAAASQDQSYNADMEHFLYDALNFIANSQNKAIFSNTVQTLSEQFYPGGVAGLYVDCADSREAVNSFLSLVFSPNVKHPITGETPLHRAASLGNIEVVQALIQSPVARLDVNEPDSEGLTPLQRAWRSVKRDESLSSTARPIQGQDSAQRFAQMLILFFEAGAPMAVSARPGSQNWGQLALAELNPWALKAAFDYGLDPRPFELAEPSANSPSSDSSDSSDSRIKIRADQCVSVIKEAQKSWEFDHPSPASASSAHQALCLNLSEKVAKSRRIAIKPRAPRNPA